MATKKSKHKAVKKIGKAVRKAVNKGVTGKAVEQVVEDAIEKSTWLKGGKYKEALSTKETSKAARPRHPLTDSARRAHSPPANFLIRIARCPVSKVECSSR